MSADKALQHEDWVVGVTASAPTEVETFFYELKTTAEKKVSVAELGSCCSLPEADQESAQHYKDAINVAYQKTGLLSCKQAKRALSDGCKYRVLKPFKIIVHAA